jgi:hypothetical protein
VPPESRDSLDMMASFPMGKVLGSVEKMEDEFELGDMGDSPLLLEFNDPEIRGRRTVATTVSTEETPEGDPWGKNDRREAGTLRTSDMASRDVFDDNELVS